MPRYIDADALKKRMFSYYDCVNENTGKSNYRGETLMNYEVADLIEDCIDNAPTADVAPRAEVEAWQKQCAKDIEELRTFYASTTARLRAEVAAEIFKELFEMVITENNADGLAFYFDVAELAELNKK